MFISGTSKGELYQYNLAVPWDVSTASGTGITLSLATYSDYFGVVFKPDGTKMYGIGTPTDNIFQYNLAVPWDILSASYIGNVNTAAQETEAQALFFSSDGTKAYIVGTINARVYQYTLSTPWGITSASYSGKSMLVSAQESAPKGLFFSSDGTKAYIVGTNAGVYQYTLSTPWDISTGSYASKYIYIGSQESNPESLSFSSDGTKVYVAGGGPTFVNSKIHQYTLSTPWDISTASYSGKNFYVGGALPVSAAFDSGGSKVVIVKQAPFEILTQYNIIGY